MPIYEYECGRCGVRFERMQKFSDPPLSVCPECGSSEVRRLITPPGIVFKGSGWYVTDSRSKSPTLESKPADKKAADSSSEKPATTAAAPAAASGDGE